MPRHPRLVLSEGQTPVSLGPSSYLILGLIARLGPSTPYDLKRAVAQSIGYFWDFPHSQLYTEPTRLAREGLLVEEREPGGRRRRVFDLTEKGRRALALWLEEPTTAPTEIRDHGLLKLYFGSLTEPAAVAALAAQQLELHRRQLVAYERFEQGHQQFAVLDPSEITLRMGLAYERAAVAFWSSILEDPPAGVERPTATQRAATPRQGGAPA